MNEFGTCQWCKKTFRLNYPEIIPIHRNAGDPYDCLGSLCRSQERKERELSGQQAELPEQLRKL